MTDRQAPAAVVRRLLPAPPDVVFDEWVDADALAEWICPSPAQATKVELNPTVGGSFRIDIDDGGGEFYVTGRYIELDRPGRLSFSWSCSNWTDQSAESVVTVTLEPHDRGQTLMTIHHILVPPEHFDDHQHGWTKIAAQLFEKLEVGG